MTSADNAFQKNTMTAFIQIGAVVLIASWCFAIIRPFVGLVVWAMIIAVALYPLHLSVAARLGGREKLSASR